MFNLEAKLLQSFRAHFIGLFLFVVRFDSEGVRFLWRYFAISLGYVIVLIKILDCEEIRECTRIEVSHKRNHTISPRSRTFSPRTRNMPRTTSA